MVKRIGIGVLALVVLVGCFDPTVPAECKGAVCGEISDPPEEGGAAPTTAGAGGTSMGGAGGVQAGGMGGLGGTAGVGGTGGVGALTVTILNPTQGATIGHGNPIDFVAEVTGGSPANDQLRWQISTQAGLFGVGYTHTKTINVVASHTLTVAVMEGDTTLASDTIDFNTN